MTLRLPTGDELADELEADGLGLPLGDSHWCIDLTAQKDSCWSFKFAQATGVDSADAHGA